MNASFFSPERFLIAAAAVILLVAGTYHLSDSPAIWYDEGFYTQAAMNLAATGEQGLQTAPGVYGSTGYVTVGYPLLAPVALAYKTFGVGVVSGRSVMVLYLVLFAAAAYCLIRTLYTGRIAALSLLLLSTFPMLYGNGKSVLGEVPGLFFLTLTLLAFLYLERDGFKDWKRYALVGLAAGLCVATKPIFALLPLALFLVTLARLRHIPLRASGIVAGLVAFALPLIVWFLLQFGVHEPVASIVSAYANPYEAGNLVALAFANAKRFLTEVTPAYTLMLALAWGAALFVSRPKRTATTTELSALAFCVLIMAHYLRMEGWYRYLFPATAVALLFLAPSLVALFDFVRARFNRLQNLSWIPYAALILLAIVQLYQTAFASYVADYYTSTRTEDVSAALTAVGPEASIFLYDAPELAILMPSKNYFQYLHPHPTLEIGKEQLAALAAGIPSVVVTGAQTVMEQPELFTGYKQISEAGPYVVLKKD